MRNTVYLADFPNAEIAANVIRSKLLEENPALLNKLDEAINLHKSRGLRFARKTNIVRDNSGELARWSRKSDIVPDITDDQILFWHFRSEILNSLSRYMRGYSM